MRGFLTPQFDRLPPTAFLRITMRVRAPKNAVPREHYRVRDHRYLVAEKARRRNECGRMPQSLA